MEESDPIQNARTGASNPEVSTATTTKTPPRTMQDIVRVIRSDPKDSSMSLSDRDVGGDSSEPPPDMAVLLSWISSTYDGKKESSLSSSVDQGFSRGQASLAILNAVRDACRIFLDDEEENPSNHTTKSGQGRGGNVPSSSKFHEGSVSPQQKQNEQYEDAFPSLASKKPQKGQSNNPNNRGNRNRNSKPHWHGNSQQKQPNSKNKRRIRPATIQPPSSDMSSNQAQNSWAPNPAFASPSDSLHSLNADKHDRPPPKASHLLEERFEQREITTAGRPTPAQERSTSNIVKTDVDHDGNRSTSAGQDLSERQHPPISTEEVAKSLPVLENLVTLYNALIDASLVPSTTLELHLMLRLLSISSRSSREGDEDKSILLAPLFSNSSRCILFASNVLVCQARLLWGLGLAQSLIACPPVKLHCTSLVAKLMELEEERRSVQAGHGTGKTLGVHVLGSTDGTALASPTSETALFTLPFDPARDSRHRFRSVQEQALYKNRESTRDAFLHQLRHYYRQNSKIGTNHNNNKHPQAKSNTPSSFSLFHDQRHMVRMVMDAVIIDNIPWFADFFKDLLLQLGPVPVVQETDKEVLQMTDSETLQKLHKRLFAPTSSSGAQKPSRRSSQSLMDSPSTASKTAFPVQGTTNNRGPNDNKGAGANQPKQNEKTSINLQDDLVRYFPGYGEFFLIFVVTADSYQFNQRLFTSLTKSLKSTIEQAFSMTRQNAHEAGRCLKRLCLLSKFIGVLLFSPFWASSPSAALPSQDKPSDILTWLSLSGILLHDVVEKAQKEHALILMLPWIADLVKMGQWAPCVLEDRSYQQLLHQLRTIQVSFCSDENLNGLIPLTNMAFLRSCMETMFRETAGLVRTVALDDDGKVNTVRYETNVEGLDQVGGIVSKGDLHASDSFIEELFDLTLFMSRPTQKRTTGTSRKLRPLQLTSEDTYASSGRTRILDSPAACPANSRESQSAIEKNLVDTFFHRHRRVKEICDFTVNQVMNDISLLLERDCIKPFTQQKLEDQEETKDTRALETSLHAQCEMFVRSLFLKRLTDTLTLLAPPNAKPEVIKMACELASNRGYERATPVIRASVMDGLKSMQQLTAKKKKQDDTNTKQENILDTGFESLSKMASHIESLVGEHANEETSVVRGTLAMLEHASSELDKFIESETSQIPPQSLLRSVYESIAKLDSYIEPKLQLWIHNTDEKCWELFVICFSFACKLTQISRYGLPSLVQFVLNPVHVSDLLKLGSTSGFAEVVVNLIRSRLLRFSTVVESLPLSELLERVVAIGKERAPEVPWDDCMARLVTNPPSS